MWIAEQLNEVRAIAVPQGASCDIWATRSSGDLYPSLQGRGPQISDMSALRWEDSQSGGTAAVVQEPASEHAEVGRGCCFASFCR